jgi:Zn-dependent protease
MDTGIDLAALRQGLIFYIVLLASLCIHEWAHAFVADRLGDDTPAVQGRVTLNPLAHMDMFGTVIFPLLCIFVLRGGLLFGWGRPVVINPSNFQHRKRDEVLTTLAGPGSNLCLALFGAIVGGYLYRTDPRTLEIFRQVISLNVALAVFNLIPIPPLDGGTVLRHAVGMTEETFYGIARYSFLILIVAFYLPPVRALLIAAIAIVGSPFAAIYQAIAG